MNKINKEDLTRTKIKNRTPCWCHFETANFNQSPGLVKESMKDTIKHEDIPVVISDTETIKDKINES